MVLKEAKIKDEAELEAILVKNPAQIEEGFEVLTRQKAYHGGSSRLDLLGTDSQKILTLVELKVVPDANQLTQALGYYDWVLERGIDWFKDAYKRDIQDAMPQIFLIAPDFEKETITSTKYLREDIKIRLFRYRCFEINNQKEVSLIEETIPRIKTIEGKPLKFEDHLNYISDKEIKEIFKQAISDIKKLDDAVEEQVKSWGLTYWIAGRKFCELYPRKEFFGTGYKTEEQGGWDNNSIHTLDEWNETFSKKIKTAFKAMKNR